MYAWHERRGRNSGKRARMGVQLSHKALESDDLTSHGGGYVAADRIQVRDFIYLDVERLKSIVAQVEQGLTEQEVRTRGKTEEAGGEIAGSILGAVKGSSNVRSLWENQQAETRSLHDFLYNRVEAALLEHDLIISLPQDLDPDVDDRDSPGKALHPTAFVLARGRVSLNDYRHIRKLLENFNEIASFLSRAQSTDADPQVPKKKRSELQREAKERLQIDKQYLKGLQLIIDVFYGDRIVIKMVPLQNDFNFRLVGNLTPSLLRDEIESITYKYGTSPESHWTMLAQIAAIPTKHRLKSIPMLGGAEIERSFQELFDATREIERMAQSVVWPEVAVTPIAIYRE